MHEDGPGGHVGDEAIVEELGGVLRVEVLGHGTAHTHLLGGNSTEAAVEQHFTDLVDTVGHVGHIWFEDGQG